MMFNKPPFFDIQDEDEKINAIVGVGKIKHPIKYPQGANKDAIASIELCLQKKADERATIDSLLEHHFLSREVLNCFRI
jgi:serine/threonine protein kinase